MTASLARRVAQAERVSETATTGLGQANDAVKALDARLTGYARQVRELLDKVDALEAGTPVQEDPVLTAVREFVATLPGAMKFGTSTVRDNTDGLTLADIRTALKTMTAAGELTQYGEWTRGGTAPMFTRTLRDED